MDCLISWPGGPAGNSAYYPHHWQLQNPLETQKRWRTTKRYDNSKSVYERERVMVYQGKAHPYQSEASLLVEQFLILEQHTCPESGYTIQK